MVFLRDRGVFMMSVRWGVVGVGRAGKARVEARTDPRSASWVGGAVRQNRWLRLHVFEVLQHVVRWRFVPDPFHATSSRGAICVQACGV